MKKILILTLLLIGTLSYSQKISNNGKLVSYDQTIVAEGTVAAGGYTAEYQAVLDAMTVDPTGDTLTWQNAMMYGLDTCGALDSSDIIYLFAQVNEQGALLNWSNPGTNDGTAVNSPDHATSGFTFDGSTDYVTCNWAPTEGVNFQLNTASIGIYITTNATQPEVVMGVSEGARTWLAPNYWGGEFEAAINVISHEVISTAIRAGYFAMSRTGASATEQYINGTSVNTGTTTATGLEPEDLYIGTSNSGGYDGYSGEVSFVYVGGALTDDQQASVNALIETYADLMGFGVQ